MNTKKLLVAYDESRSIIEEGDFLCVVFEGATPVFFGLKSRRNYKTGLMVFIGKQISAKNIFSKLVDSGRKIENVDQALKNIEDYVQQIECFKIGNIITVVPKSCDPGFELFKVADMPNTEKKSLP